MKKSTLSLFLLLFILNAYSQQNYSEFEANNSLGVNNSSSEGFEVVSNNMERLPILDTYTDRADFQNAYNTDCTIPLISEDFSGGPGAITNCGPVVSSDGDSCFASGSLEEGFTVTAMGTGSNEVIFIPAGGVGNTSDLVGANSFSDYTILTFVDEEIYAVGHDIFNNSSLESEYRIYDVNGDLLESYTLTSGAPASENFFGFISDEPIGFIEIEGAAEDGELFGNLEYGVCDNLSVNDNLLNLVSVYPNPATDIINIKAPSNIQVTGATLYDLLGKNTGVVFANGQVDVSTMSRGVYMLTVETNEGSITQKIVKR